MNQKKVITLCLSICCGFNFALCSAALADTNASVEANTNTTDATKASVGANAGDSYKAPADANAAASTDLDGAAKKKSTDERIESEITAAEQVVLDLEQCCRHLHRTAGDLINEATQQQLEVVATADDVGPILLAPPLAGVMPAGGFLPCRKKFLDLLMNQLHDILPMMTAEAGKIELDDEAKTATASDALQAITSTAGKLKDRVGNLDKLTQGPEYDNHAIYKEAKALQEQVARMSESCKTLTKELKREDKSISKELRLLEKQIKNRKP